MQRDFGKIDVKAAISAVRQVLIDVWDPIGVREIGWPEGRGSCP